MESKYLHALLAKSSRLHWVMFYLLAVLSVALSVFQQYHFFVNKNITLQKQISEISRSVTLFSEQLNVLRESNNATIVELSNAQIANVLEQWEVTQQAKVLNLDFVKETHNKNLDVVRIVAECTTSLSGLYALLDKVLGKELFIDTLVIDNDSENQVRVKLQLVQPLRKT